MRLYKPDTYKNATNKERQEVCNGCGTKGLGGVLVPDHMYGLDISEACDIHDWMYSEGETIQDKNVADRAFLNNIVRIIECKSSKRWFKKPLITLRKRRALKYYHAVKYFGGTAFWSGK